MESEVFVEELECQLTAREVLQRGQQAARVAHEIDELEKELDRTKKAHKVRVGQLEHQLKTAQREVRTGKTERSVRCTEQADYDEAAQLANESSFTYHTPDPPPVWTRCGRS